MLVDLNLPVDSGKDSGDLVQQPLNRSIASEEGAHKRKDLGHIESRDVGAPIKTSAVHFSEAQLPREP